MYRDARITSIYEGTSQLQVVAAIRSVVNGQYSSMIQTFEQVEVTPEWETTKAQLQTMAVDYETARQIIQDLKNEEALDFNARRLVEMAAHLIMTYLLMFDAMRCDCFKRSVHTYLRAGKAINLAHFDLIKNFTIENLAEYKH
jgi:alkylation response protein AidB-like acyl-CoA dehydrogenase